MMKILIIALGFGIITADFPPSCLRMLDLSIFLHDCCQYPVIERRSEVYGTCLQNCSEFDYCCFQECSAKESGIFNESENGLNSKRLKEIFVSHTEKGNYKNLTEEWTTTLNQSIDKCNAPRSKEVSVCEFIYQRMACIFKENFINCPVFSVKESCKTVKTEMEDCGNEKNSWRFITDAFNRVKSSYARRYAETYP